MRIKRSLFSGRVKEVDGDRIKWSLFNRHIKRIGNKKVTHYLLNGEIKSIGGQKVRRSLLTGQVLEAPEEYFKIQSIEDENSRNGPVDDFFDKD